MIDRLMIAAACLVLLGANVHGQELDEGKSNADAFAETAKQIAAEYSIEAGDQTLKLRADPVLKWTDPENGEVYGNVFVWTDAGRPAVIASIYKWYRPHTHSTHEFQSLSTKSILAQRDGQKEWRCIQSGVDWKPVPGAASVGQTAVQRLARMRMTARKFSLKMTNRDQSVDQLRILARPLYRYEIADTDSPASEVLDGALFAYARGTDPEVLLLLEVRQESGQPRLYYALARSNFVPMSATFEGKEVWSVEKLDNKSMHAKTEPYTKFIFKKN